MQALAAAGVNRVYLDVWNQGKVYFNSSTMANLVGTAGLGTDQLSWGVANARQNGLQVFAWFEYGFMSAYGSPDNAFAQYAQQQGWQLGTTSNGFVWLDASNPSVVNFLGNIMADAVNNYNLDGVQLDDHFAYPVELAGSNTGVMTTAAEGVRKIVRGVSSASLSLAPNPYSTSVNSFNVDWVKWADLGLFSEYAPQLYTSTFSSFQTDLSETLSAAPSSLDQYLIIGLRCDGSGGSTSWDDLSQMISTTASNNLGVSIWYANGILNTYPSQFQTVWG